VPAAPAPARDPDDHVAPPTTPHRTLTPEQAAPDERPPEPSLPIATGGMVALGGCGAGAVPLFAMFLCPYAAVLAPATSCCGTVGTAAAMTSKEGGHPIAAGAAAAGGVTLGAVLGGAAAAGIAAGYTSGNQGCLNDGLCVLAWGTVVAAGVAVGATFIGPILGGGAVTIVEQIRLNDAAATATVEKTTPSRNTPTTSTKPTSPTTTSPTTPAAL
jgi:hypothetical protein